MLNSSFENSDQSENINIFQTNTYYENQNL